MRRQKRTQIGGLEILLDDQQGDLNSVQVQGCVQWLVAKQLENRQMELHKIPIHEHKQGEKSQMEGYTWSEVSTVVT